MGGIQFLLRKRIQYYRLKKKKITIGRHVDISNATIDPYVNLAHHSQVSDVCIGKRTSIGRYSKLRYADIGKYCSVSWDVTIGATEHPIHAFSTHAFPYRKLFGLCNQDMQIDHKRVVIGNDVWIGCGAIIMPGVVIGDGSIIGAGAVVTHDVGSYEIVAGCPAKHISWRFSKDIVEALERIKWWEASDEFLRKNIELFSYENDLSQQKELLCKLEAEMLNRKET